MHIRSLIRVISFFLFISCMSSTHAQGDSSLSSPRQFDRQSMQQYSTQRDFKYEDVPPAEMSIWDWVKYRFLRLLSKIFSPHQQTTVIKILFYLLMIFGIVMIVLNLAGVKIGRFIVRDGKTIIAPHMAEENIREMNMDALIADAAAKKQWRLSVRYQYLKALRLLTDRELIRWQPGKTNMDYYYELREDGLKNTFLIATADFENAWYGNSEVTEGHYQESKKSLENFYTQILNYRA